MKNPMLKSLLAFSGILMAMYSFSQPLPADEILGKWLNEDQDAHIQIYQENGKYYGKIVWLKEPIDEDTGNPKLDDENSDETLRDRPIMGLIMLKDFVYDDDDKEWDDGTIYDPKNGKTYDCYMHFDENKVLKIRGYIGFSWIGRNTYWTRVE